MGTQLYPGIAFSPSAALTDNVGAGDTIIPVSDVGAFPPAPNLATIGTDEEGETILYAAKTATALSGCVRGVEGTARAWSAGEPIARNWTAKDHGDLITAVEGAAEAAQNTQDALAEHQVDSTAHGELFAAKQSKLTGTSGQVVGFSADGAAQAVRGWSNQNLLDNWYFADPIDQRGQAEYTAAGYTIDRWRLFFGTMQVFDGGITLTPQGNVRAQFAQAPENPAELYGKVVTLSFYIDGQIYSQTVSIPQNPLYPFDATAAEIDGVRPYIYQSAENAVFQVGLRVEAGADAKSVAAAKLELGSVQTLAYQDADGNWVLNDPPPNKALELLKCQRYFVRYLAKDYDLRIGYAFAYSQTNVSLQIPLPCSIRTTPAISFSATAHIADQYSEYSIAYLAVATFDKNLLTLDATTDLTTPMTIGRPALLHLPVGSYLDIDANL